MTREVFHRVIDAKDLPVLKVQVLGIKVKIKKVKNPLRNNLPNRSNSLHQSFKSMKS